MIELVLRIEAEADLRAIIEYYQDVAPHVVVHIQQDIERAFSLLQRHPLIGPPLADRPFRRIVTSRYKFKIAYLPEPDRIVVLGLFRFQDREA